VQNRSAIAVRVRKLCRQNCLHIRGADPGMPGIGRLAPRLETIPRASVFLAICTEPCQVPCRHSSSIPANRPLDASQHDLAARRTKSVTVRHRRRPAAGAAHAHPREGTKPEFFRPPAPLAARARAPCGPSSTGIRTEARPNFKGARCKTACPPRAAHCRAAQRHAITARWRGATGRASRPKRTGHPGPPPSSTRVQPGTAPPARPAPPRPGPKLRPEGRRVDTESARGARTATSRPPPAGAPPPTPASAIGWTSFLF
jgi:hypothetical protein